MPQITGPRGPGLLYLEVHQTLGGIQSHHFPSAPPSASSEISHQQGGHISGGQGVESSMPGDFCQSAAPGTDFPPLGPPGPLALSPPSLCHQGGPLISTRGGRRVIHAQEFCQSAAPGTDFPPLGPPWPLALSPPSLCHQGGPLISGGRGVESSMPRIFAKAQPQGSISNRRMQRLPPPTPWREEAGARHHVPCMISTHFVDLSVYFSLLDELLSLPTSGCAVAPCL